MENVFDNLRASGHIDMRCLLVGWERVKRCAIAYTRFHPTGEWGHIHFVKWESSPSRQVGVIAEVAQWLTNYYPLERRGFESRRRNGETA